MEKVKDFLIFNDVIRSGACSDEVIAWCEKHDAYMGSTEDMIALCSDEREENYIRAAAGQSGDGNGYGNGDGYGDGNGDGNGY